MQTEYREGCLEIAAAMICVECLLDVLEKRLPLNALSDLSYRERTAGEAWILKVCGGMTANLYELLGKAVNRDREDDGFRFHERQMLDEVKRYLAIGCAESRCELAHAMTALPLPINKDAGACKNRFEAYMWAARCAADQFNLSWNEFFSWQYIDPPEFVAEYEEGTMVVTNYGKWSAARDKEVSESFRAVHDKFIETVSNDIVWWAEVPFGWEPAVEDGHVVFPPRPIRNERELLEWLEKFKRGFQLDGSFPLSKEYGKRFQNILREMRNAQRTIEGWGIAVGEIEFDDVYQGERELIKLARWLQDRNPDPVEEFDDETEGLADGDEPQGQDYQEEPKQCEVADTPSMRSDQKSDRWNECGVAPPDGYFGPLAGTKKHLARWILATSSDHRSLTRKLDGMLLWGREMGRYGCEVWFRDRNRFVQANTRRLQDEDLRGMEERERGREKP